MTIIQRPSFVYSSKVILEEINEFNVDNYCPTLNPLELLYKYPLKKEVIAKLLGITPRGINNYIYKQTNPMLPVQRLAAELDIFWSSINKANSGD
ncbi:MAG: hypothetical protein WBA93_27950 [Microcoleaceae cyanobacterium]